MENAVMIAKIIWPVFAAVTIGMFVAPAMYEKANAEFLKSSIWMYVGWMMAMLIGVLMVGSYRAWNADWTVVVTLLGYLSLLKGILLLVFPQIASDLRSKFWTWKSASIGWAVVMAIITLILIYGVYFS